MSELVLLEEETISLQVDLLRYYGVVAAKVQATLSNKRLVLIAKNKWEEKLFAKPIEILLTEITDIHLEQINQLYNIQVGQNKKIIIAGSAATILISLLQKAINNSAPITPPTYQAEISLSRGGGFSSPGLLIIRDNHLLLQSYAGAKALFLPVKQYNIDVHDIQEHSFYEVGDKIAIKTANQTISFFGEGALVCNVLLNLQKNDDQLVGTVLTVNQSKSGTLIPSTLFVCQNNLYIMATKIFHRNFSKPYEKISLSKISHIALEGKKEEKILAIHSADTSWQLSCRNPTYTYDQLAQDISKSLEMRKKREPSREQKSTELLRERIQYLYKDRIQFGYLCLSLSDVQFIPETGSSLAMSISLAKLTKVKALRNLLVLSVEKHKFAFASPFSKNIQKIVDTIQSTTPPAHLLRPKGGIPLNQIKGNAFRIVIQHDGKRMEAGFLKIQIKADHVLLLLSECPSDFSPQKNALLIIDVAKAHERYCFTTRIISLSHESNNPIIKAILIVETPNNIFRHSLRKELRAPIHQQSNIRMLLRNGKEVPTEYIAKHVQPITFPVATTINNISSAGCQLTFPFVLPAKWVKAGLHLEFVLLIQEEEFIIQGRCLYSVSNPKKPQEYICGLYFEDLPSNIQEKLQIHLQKWEQSSKNSVTASEQHVLDEFNPLMRSAMKLIETPSFSNLSLSEAVQFLNSGNFRIIEKGEMLIQEGAEGDSLFVLTAGQVEVQTGGTILATLEEGAAIGEMSLLDPAPRTASVIANTTVSVIEIPKAIFDASVLAGDQTSIKILQSLAETILERLNTLQNKIQDELNNGDLGSIHNILPSSQKENQ